MPGGKHTEEQGARGSIQPRYPSYKEQLDYFYKTGAAAQFVKHLPGNPDEAFEPSVRLVDVMKELCWGFQGQYLTAMQDFAEKYKDRYPDFKAPIERMLQVYSEREAIARRKLFDLSRTGHEQLIHLDDFSQQVDELLEKKCPDNYREFKSFENAFGDKFLEPMIVLHAQSQEKDELDGMGLLHLLDCVNIDMLRDRKKVGFDYFAMLSEKVEEVVDASQGCVPDDVANYLKTVDEKNLSMFIEEEDELAKEHAEDLFFNYTSLRSATFKRTLKVEAVIFSILLVIPLIALLIHCFCSKKKDQAFDARWGGVKDGLSTLSESSQKTVIKNGDLLLDRARRRKVVRRKLEQLCRRERIVLTKNTAFVEPVVTAQHKTPGRTESPKGVTDLSNVPGSGAKLSKVTALFKQVPQPVQEAGPLRQNCRSELLSPLDQMSATLMACT